MSTEVLTVSNLRNQLLHIIKDLEKTPDRYIITRKGEPRAILLNYKEFESLLATLEILSDPEMIKGIEEGRRDIKAKRVKSFEDVFEEPF